jgi:flagellar export protein FliJ
LSKFKFRLATFERVCEAARDERRLQLAEALRLDESLQERHQSLDLELAELLAAAQQTASPGWVNVDRLIAAQQYELVLRSEQHTLARQRATLEAEIERRREALIAADREVRTLEKLRESQQQKFRQEEERREIKLLDEVASRRAGGEAEA